MSKEYLSQDQSIKVAHLVDFFEAAEERSAKALLAEDSDAYARHLSNLNQYSEELLTLTGIDPRDPFKSSVPKGKA